MTHSGKDEASLPKPVVGHGHPLDPNRGKLLSVDDEKRVDEEGRPIAEGLLWSEAHTGAYLCLALTREDGLSISNTPIGYHTTNKNLQHSHIHVFCSVGKPKINQSYVGACIELPSDLGRDSTKQLYITEWIAATAAESLVQASETHLAHDPILANQMASWVALSANESINKLGL